MREETVGNRRLNTETERQTGGEDRWDQVDEHVADIMSRGIHFSEFQKERGARLKRVD